ITKGNKLIVLSPMEVISFYTSISAMLAFGLTVPLLCHFLWQFVKPGLNETENRFFSLYSPVILLLFLNDIAFGYYIVNTLCDLFLILYSYTLEFSVLSWFWLYLFLSNGFSVRILVIFTINKHAVWFVI